MSLDVHEAAALLAAARGDRRRSRASATTTTASTRRRAYDVQDVDRVRRAEAGERVVEIARLGLASTAKQQTMDVHQPSSASSPTR